MSPLEAPWAQPLVAFFEQYTLARALAPVLLGLVVGWIVSRIVSRLLSPLAARTSTQVDDELIAVVPRPIFLSGLLAGIWVATLWAGAGPALTVLVRRMLASVAVLIWTSFVVRASFIFLEALGRAQDRIGFVQPRTLPLLENASKILIWGGSVYFLFLVWGIDVAGWLAAAGVIGIAVGFAAKDTLANLFSGIFILADAPYKVGDFVNLENGARGQVTHVGLRSTRLLTRDDVEITVPNAVIANARIVNESGGPSEQERIRVKVGVAYGTDIDAVQEILLEIAGDCADVSATPEPRVRFRAFGESSLDFELLCWIHEPVLRGRALDSLHRAVYQRFADAGIEIPFPQRDVWIRAQDAPGKAPEPPSGPDQV